jgi:hypothetical protein
LLGGGNRGDRRHSDFGDHDDRRHSDLGDSDHDDLRRSDLGDSDRRYSDLVGHTNHHNGVADMDYMRGSIESMTLVSGTDNTISKKDDRRTPNNTDRQTPNNIGGVRAPRDWLYHIEVRLAGQADPLSWTILRDEADYDEEEQ